METKCDDLLIASAREPQASTHVVAREPQGEHALCALAAGGRLAADDSAWHLRELPEEKGDPAGRAVRYHCQGRCGWRAAGP